MLFQQILLLYSVLKFGSGQHLAATSMLELIVEKREVKQRNQILEFRENESFTVQIESDEEIYHIRCGKGKDIYLDHDLVPFGYGRRYVVQEEITATMAMNAIWSCVMKFRNNDAPLSFNLSVIVKMAGENACEKTPCHSHATCIGSSNGYQCECNNGYTGNGYNQCLQDFCQSNPCPMHSLCENKYNRHECRCNVDYVMKDGLCVQCRTCDSGAECRIVDNITTCVFIAQQEGPPSSTTYLPERGGKNMDIPIPIVNIFLYRNEYGKLFYRINNNTKVALKADEKFEIYLTLQNDKVLKVPNRIMCYNEAKKTEVHINDPLAKATRINYFKAMVPRAFETMAGNWTCLISSKSTFKEVIVHFPVVVLKNSQVQQGSGAPTGTEKGTARTPSGPETATVSSAYQQLPQYNNCISIDRINDTDFNVREIYNLTNDHAFTLVIKNNEATTILKDISCYSKKYSAQSYINSTLQYNDTSHEYKIEVPKAKRGMEAEWNCTVTDNSSNQKVIEFKVNIFKTPVPSRIYINDVLITSDENTSSDYKFIEGEMVKVTCKKIKGMVMHLKYSDLDTEITTQSNDKTEQIMYMKMKKSAEAVSCKVDENFNKIPQVLFRKTPLNEDWPWFSVNGLNLARISQGGAETTYQYEYYIGESLSIAGDAFGQKWSCGNNIKSFDENGKLNFTMVATQSEGYNYSCLLEKRSLTIKLRPIPDYFDPVVGGLSLAQTKEKYLAIDGFKTTFLNEGNKILNVTCHSKRYIHCRWDVQSAEKWDSELQIMIQVHTYLPQNTSSTVIQCTCEKGTSKFTHEVTIIEKEKQEPENEDLFDPDDRDKDGSTKIDSYKWLLFLPALLIIGLVVRLIVGNQRNKRKREQAIIASQINYENLPAHNEGPMAHPQQWDNYATVHDCLNTAGSETYSVPCVERDLSQLYASVVPKSQRGSPAETLYAEVGFAGIDTEPNYACVQPKDLEASRGQPKKPSGMTNAHQVLPNPEDIYAEVKPKSLRKDPGTANYANVFENQRYVNAEGKAKEETSDYAEPYALPYSTSK